MDSLSAGAFQEVIDAGNDKQFVAMLLQMDEALVGVYHLLQVDILLHDVGKGIFGVIFFIHADDFFQATLVFTTMVVKMPRGKSPR